MSEGMFSSFHSSCLCYVSAKQWRKCIHSSSSKKLERWLAVRDRQEQKQKQDMGR